MQERHQILSRKDSRELTEYLSSNDQLISPMVDLIEQSRLAVYDLIDEVGRATIEAILLMSVAGVAGEHHQGKKGGDILRHGHQAQEKGHGMPCPY